MKRTLAIQVIEKQGKRVLLKGWADKVRNHGKMVFVDLRDRSGIVQIVGSSDLAQVGKEFVLEIIGRVKKRPLAQVNKDLVTGEVEVEVESYKILEKSLPMPFDMDRDALDLELPTLLNYRSLTLRHKRIRAIFRVQETIMKTFRHVLRSEGFVEFEAPTIVPVATEGGAEVFSIDYYGRKAYLAQSPQLYKQMMVSVFERVFTVGRAYRAEPSTTTRHLSEYITMDAEMGFISSWTDLTDMVERVVRRIFAALEAENRKELELFGALVPKIGKRIPLIKMREAQEIIYKRTGRDNRTEPDLEPEDEREICRWALENYGSELIFITHYPVKKRPFYTYPDPIDPEYTLSFDLLGRGLEWVTGGQRINNYEQLIENIKKWGNDPADFELYLQAFKYGMPPEGGFALGAERVTMQVLGLGNIREASLFPRDMERVDNLKLGSK